MFITVAFNVAVYSLTHGIPGAQKGGIVWRIGDWVLVLFALTLPVISAGRIARRQVFSRPQSGTRISSTVAHGRSINGVNRLRMIDSQMSLDATSRLLQILPP